MLPDNTPLPRNYQITNEERRSVVTALAWARYYLEQGEDYNPIASGNALKVCLAAVGVKEYRIWAFLSQVGEAPDGHGSR